MADNISQHAPASMSHRESVNDEPRTNSPSRRSPCEESAADIRMIREIVLAAAKKYSVEISRETLPTAALEALRPEAEAYNEIATIEYQLDQLPKDGVFSSDPREPYSFGKFSPVLTRLPLCPPLRGLTKICSWRLRNLGSRCMVSLNELSYDSMGYVCALEPNSGEAGLSLTIDERVLISGDRDKQSPAWKGQRFGKEWIFEIDANNDMDMSVVTSQLLRQDRYGNMSQQEREYWANNFLSRFKGDWRQNRMDNYGGREGEDLFFQYHMRLFQPEQHAKGLKLKRTTGLITAPDTGAGLADLGVGEMRYSVGLKTTWAKDLPIFSMVVLSDDPGVSFRLKKLSDSHQWTNANISPSGRATGISAFALRIRLLCDEWKSRWDEMLDGIDNSLQTDLDCILSPEKRQSIMYDSTGFQLSEFYFAILQILRIASEWIEESMADLRRLVDDMEEGFFPIGRGQMVTLLPDSPEAQRWVVEVFKRNWESVISHQQGLGDDLLGRISRKKEVVESLRDGLFSATSINESTNSARLNHYTLVFTVVAIFFLPLSFVTGLFDLDLFSWEDPGQKRSFILTMVLVAVATYSFSALLVWGFRKPERRETLKDGAKDIRRGIKERVGGVRDGAKDAYHKMRHGSILKGGFLRQEEKGGV